MSTWLTKVLLSGFVIAAYVGILAISGNVWSIFTALFPFALMAPWALEIAGGFKVIAGVLERLGAHRVLLVMILGYFLFSCGLLAVSHRDKSMILAFAATYLALPSYLLVGQLTALNVPGIMYGVLIGSYLLNGLVFYGVARLWFRGMPSQGKQ